MLSLAMILAFGIPLIHAVASPDPPAGPPCQAPEYHQFDFWLGTWDIEQDILTEDGSYARFPAKNRVEAVASGCAVVEHWRGTVQFYWEGMEAPDSLYGLSVRSFDDARGEWSIYWLDSRHPSFGDPFVGGFDNGLGTFTRRVRRLDGTVSLSRIVFEPVDATSVEWNLDVSADDGERWTTVWRMHFHHASVDPGSDGSPAGAG
jgi:hypothetical protein